MAKFFNLPFLQLSKLLTIFLSAKTTTARFVLDIDYMITPGAFEILTTFINETEWIDDLGKCLNSKCRIIIRHAWYPPTPWCSLAKLSDINWEKHEISLNMLDFFLWYPPTPLCYTSMSDNNPTFWIQTFPLYCSDNDGWSINTLNHKVPLNHIAPIWGIQRFSLFLDIVKWLLVSNHV